VFDQFDHRRIPVVALAVVEHAVAPDHEVAGVAVGQRRRNVHLVGSTVAPALTISQERLTQISHPAVGADVVHPDAEIAAAAVDEEPARLEDGLGARPIKILK